MARRGASSSMRPSLARHNFSARARGSGGLRRGGSTMRAAAVWLSVEVMAMAPRVGWNMAECRPSRGVDYENADVRKSGGKKKRHEHTSRGYAIAVLCHHLSVTDAAHNARTRSDSLTRRNTRKLASSGRGRASAGAIGVGRVREIKSRQVREPPGVSLSRATSRRASSLAAGGGALPCSHCSRRPDARIEVGGGPDQLALGPLGALELDLVGRPPLGRPRRLAVVPGGSMGSEVSV